MGIVSLEHLTQLFMRANLNNEVIKADEALVGDVEDYQSLETNMRHLSICKRSPDAMGYILSQIQYLKNFNSRTEALEYLINNIKSKLADIPDAKVAENINNIFTTDCNYVVAQGLKNYHLLFSEDDKPQSFFRNISALVLGQNNKILSNNLLLIGHLLVNFSKDKQNNKEMKDGLLKFITSNYSSLFMNLSSLPHLDHLLGYFPAAKAELMQCKGHLHDEIWNTFADIMISGVKNRELFSYPYADLNKDGSVSLLLGSDDPSNLDKEILAKFTAFAGSPYFSALLSQAMNKCGVKMMDPSRPLIEISGEDEKVCRFNMNPEQLDQVLKSLSSYAYRGQYGITNLSKQFGMKDDVIMLAPIYHLEGNDWVMRSVGCQMSEMPTVQLLKLIGNDGKTKEHLHWEPKEVYEKMGVDSSVINNIINKLFADMSSKTIHFGTDNAHLLHIPPTVAAKFRIVDLDEKARHFYLAHGNTGSSELEHCKSIEVPIADFLQLIKTNLEINITHDPDNANLKAALVFVNGLVEKHKSSTPEIRVNAFGKELGNPEVLESDLTNNRTRPR